MTNVALKRDDIKAGMEVYFIEIVDEGSKKNPEIVAYLRNGKVEDKGAYAGRKILSETGNKMIGSKGVHSVYSSLDDLEDVLFVVNTELGVEKDRASELRSQAHAWARHAKGLSITNDHVKSVVKAQDERYQERRDAYYAQKAEEEKAEKEKRERAVAKYGPIVYVSCFGSYIHKGDKYFEDEERRKYSEWDMMEITDPAYLDNIIGQGVA